MLTLRDLAKKQPLQEEKWFDNTGLTATWANIVLQTLREKTGLDWRQADFEHRRLGSSQKQDLLTLQYGDILLVVSAVYPIRALLRDTPRDAFADVLDADRAIQILIDVRLQSERPNASWPAKLLTRQGFWVDQQEEFDAITYRIFNPSRVILRIAKELRSNLEGILRTLPGAIDKHAYHVWSRATDIFNPKFNEEPVSWSSHELGPKQIGTREDKSTSAGAPTLEEEMRLTRLLQKDQGKPLPTTKAPEGQLHGAPRVLRQLKANALHRQLSPLKKAHKRETGVQTMGSGTRGENVPSKASSGATKLTPKSAFTLANRSFSKGDTAHKPPLARLQKTENQNSIEVDRRFISARVADPQTDPNWLAAAWDALDPGDAEQLINMRHFGGNYRYKYLIPGTSTELSNYSQDQREDWRVAIAENPNAPYATLEKAQHLAPTNPMIPLAALEDPGNARAMQLNRQVQKVIAMLPAIQQELGKPLYGYVDLHGHYQRSEDGQGAAWWAHRRRDGDLLDAHVVPAPGELGGFWLIAAVKADPHFYQDGIKFLVRLYPTYVSAANRLPGGINAKIHRLR